MELIWTDASACLDNTWISKNALSVFQVQKAKETTLRYHVMLFALTQDS